MAEEHVKAFSGVPNVQITGVFSRTRPRAEALAARYGITHVCDSVPELYNQTKAQLVVVAVSVMAMHAVGSNCLNYPWKILLEKPPGRNLQEAEDLAALARAKNYQVLVALNRRFLSSTCAVLSDLEQLAGPRFIKVQDQQDLTVARRHGHPEAVVRDWMYGNSIHVIDYLILLGRGKVTEIIPFRRWTPENPQLVLAGIKFDSGDTGLYEGIWNGPGPWAVSVSLPDKCWEMRPLEEAAYQLRGERRQTPLDIHVWDKEYKPGFRLQAEMAVAAARGEVSRFPTLDDTLETMRLIAGIFDTSA